MQKVQKAYAFEIEDVPVTSEYLEVRYSVSQKLVYWCHKLQATLSHYVTVSY